MVDDEEDSLDVGDTIVVPAGSVRQVPADGRVELLVSCPAGAIASVPGEAQDRGTPPWIA